MGGVDPDRSVLAAVLSVPFGVAKLVRASTAATITLVAVGVHVHTCLAAAKALKENTSIDCEVIDLRTIVPLDMETVLTSVRATGRLLVVDEAYSMCGVGAEIIASVASTPGHQLPQTAVTTTSEGVALVPSHVLCISVLFTRVRRRLTDLLVL